MTFSTKRGIGCSKSWSGKAFSLPSACVCEHAPRRPRQNWLNCACLPPPPPHPTPRALSLAVPCRNPDKSADIVNLTETAEVVGMSAVIVQDLKSRRVKNYEFDWDRILKPEGDTGPFLQYTHARLCRCVSVGRVARCSAFFFFFFFFGSAAQPTARA